MINLIFDGHYLVHKNVFTLHKNKCLFGDFHKALTVNIEKFIGLIKGCKVHVVFDGKNTWRKQAYDAYKANRKDKDQDEEIDWKWVFTELKIWIEDARENTNWNIYQENGLEGDDWIMGLVKFNNKKNESNIVIASDKDLLQLLKWTSSYINVQIKDIMSQEKVYFPEGFEIFLKQQDDSSGEDDLFNMGANKFNLNAFLSNLKASWNFEEINTNQFLFEKIVRGDSGDNIGAIYSKMTKSGKMQNIAEGGAKKVWKIYSEQYGESYKTNEEVFYDRMIECLELKEKKTFDDDIKSGIKEKIKHNIKMMELNVRNYPQDVLDILMDQLH